MSVLQEEASNYKYSRDTKSGKFSCHGIYVYHYQPPDQNSQNKITIHSEVDHSNIDPIKIKFFVYDEFCNDVEELHILFFASLDDVPNENKKYHWYLSAQLINIEDPSLSYTKELNVTFAKTSIYTFFEFPVSWKELPSGWLDGSKCFYINFYAQNYPQEKRPKYSLKDIMSRSSRQFNHPKYDYTKQTTGYEILSAKTPKDIFSYLLYYLLTVPFIQSEIITNYERNTEVFMDKFPIQRHFIDIYAKFTRESGDESKQMPFLPSEPLDLTSLRSSLKIEDYAKYEFPLTAFIDTLKKEFFEQNISTITITEHDIEEYINIDMQNIKKTEEEKQGTVKVNIGKLLKQKEKEKEGAGSTANGMSAMQRENRQDMLVFIEFPHKYEERCKAAGKEPYKRAYEIPYPKGVPLTPEFYIFGLIMRGSMDDRPFLRLIWKKKQFVTISDYGSFLTPPLIDDDHQSLMKNVIGMVLCSSRYITKYESPTSKDDLRSLSEYRIFMYTEGDITGCDSSDDASGERAKLYSEYGIFPDDKSHRNVLKDSKMLSSETTLQQMKDHDRNGFFSQEGGEFYAFKQNHFERLDGTSLLFQPGYKTARILFLKPQPEDKILLFVKLFNRMPVKDMSPFKFMTEIYSSPGDTLEQLAEDICRKLDNKYSWLTPQAISKWYLQNQWNAVELREKEQTLSSHNIQFGATLIFTLNVFLTSEYQSYKCPYEPPSYAMNAELTPDFVLNDKAKACITFSLAHQNEVEQKTVPISISKQMLINIAAGKAGRTGKIYISNMEEQKEVKPEDDLKEVLLEQKDDFRITVDLDEK